MHVTCHVTGSIEDTVSLLFNAFFMFWLLLAEESKQSQESKIFERYGLGRTLLVDPSGCHLRPTRLPATFLAKPVQSPGVILSRGKEVLDGFLIFSC